MQVLTVTLVVSHYMQQVAKMCLAGTLDSIRSIREVDNQTGNIAAVPQVVTSAGLTSAK